MHQNKILLLCVFMLLTSTVVAQWNKFPVPKVEHIVYNKWDKKYGIRYYLPTYPAMLLDSIFLFNSVKYNNADQLIKLKIKGDTVEIFGYSIKGGFNRLKKDDPIRLISKTTHRYILVNRKRVSFYFDTDVTFGFPDFVFSDYNFYIKFVGTKSDDGNVIEQDY